MVFGWGLINSGWNFTYGVGGCSVASKGGLCSGEPFYGVFVLYLRPAYKLGFAMASRKHRCIGMEEHKGSGLSRKT